MHARYFDRYYRWVIWSFSRLALGFVALALVFAAAAAASTFTGNIYMVAGNGTFGFSGDGG